MGTKDSISPLSCFLQHGFSVATGSYPWMPRVKKLRWVGTGYDGEGKKIILKSIHKMDKGRKLPNQISMLSFFLIAHPLVLLFKEPKYIVWKKNFIQTFKFSLLSLKLVESSPQNSRTMRNRRRGMAIRSGKYLGGASLSGRGCPQWVILWHGK